MNVWNVGVLLQWIVCIHFLSFAKILNSSMFFQRAYVATIKWFFFFLYHHFSPACAVGVIPRTRCPAQAPWTALAFSAKTKSLATSIPTEAFANTATESCYMLLHALEKRTSSVSNFEVENIVTIHMKLKALCSAQYQAVFIYSFRPDNGPDIFKVSHRPTAAVPRHSECCFAGWEVVGAKTNSNRMQLNLTATNWPSSEAWHVFLT